MIFPKQALEELVDDRTSLPGRPADLLARREAADPRGATHAIAGESYRFGHVQIREAAYRRLLRRDRAALHERFVDWGEQSSRSAARDRVRGDHRLPPRAGLHVLLELGPLDRHGRELGARAAERLTASGRRALARGDMPAAASLLLRAAPCCRRRDRAA